MSGAFIHPSAEVHRTAEMGEGSKVWANSHIRENVVIGRNVTIGEGVYIGPGVVVGDNSKIQNLCQIFDPATIDEGVFLGPGVILTNDRIPRAISESGNPLASGDWNLVGVKIRKGASIGAGVVCVAPLEIGEWSLIAAGSVVTKDILPHSLSAGAPAVFKKWVSKKGTPLVQIADNSFSCPISGEKFSVDETGKLRIR